MKTPLEEIMLWYELHRLQERYVSVIDTDRLEAWPDFFCDDGLYRITTAENVAHPASCLGTPLANGVEFRNAAWEQIDACPDPRLPIDTSNAIGSRSAHAPWIASLRVTGFQFAATA